ncbi:hypothetical protein MTO96_039040 [Rhipicephalus appendiculatus]
MLNCTILSASFTQHRDNVLVENAVPAQEPRVNTAARVPLVLETTFIRLPEGSASETEFSRTEVPYTSHHDVRRKTKEVKVKLWKQRDLNRRLQANLQRQRQALKLREVVRSVRSHVSPAVAALVEAQLRMKDVSRFGCRWSSKNKSFALVLYFHCPKGYRYCRRLLRRPSV